MFRIAAGILAVGITIASVSAQSLTSALRSELAPTGTLRAGINYNNPLVARRDPATGELRGTAVDLSRELARRTGVPVELIPYESAGRMSDAARSGAWDVAFLAVDPARASEVEFTAPYIELEGTYLVPAGSPLRRIEDVDRDGVRIAVTAKSAYDLFLTRELKHAQLVRAATTPESIDLMVAQKLDALAAVRTALVAAVRQVNGAQILSGHFMTIAHAAAVPRGRPAAAAFVRQFVEDAKASGLVAAALARHGLTPDDAIVAPAVSAR
jgi:polar amino acid transport system substrate-binding protein